MSAGSSSALPVSTEPGTYTNSLYRSLTEPTMSINTYAGVSDPMKSSKPFDYQLLWILLCILGLTLGLAIATGCYMWERKHMPEKVQIRRIRKSTIRTQSVEKEVKALRQQPVQVHEFVNKLRQKKLDKFLNFEVRAIVHHQVEFPCTIATKPENIHSNVTQEVVPYDHSLVKIEGFSFNEEEMYINASHIQGYSTHKGYIATQGPRGNTIAAFWQMVWQQDVHVIVMATGLFEHAVQQCEKYWGSVRSADKYIRHGDMHIHLTDTRLLTKLTIRTFQIFPEGSDSTRTIHHFEMTGFTDDGTEPGYLLDVRRRVNRALDSVPGPLLVHCRCGGSRTATYIAVDYCIRQLEQENFVDIFSAVLHLRKFRTNMTRTLSQYRLIYDTVALYIQVRSTVIPCAILPTTTHTMSITDPQTNTNGYQKEFQLLEEIVPKLSVGDCASGHREENRKKSRDIMMLPPERARPYLQTIVEMSDSGTDFINAVLVDGFHQEGSYIVTQWPIEGTMNDIWRLLFDYKINTFIVLHENKNTRSTPCFWPKELDKEIRYGPIGVKYLGCQKYPHIVIRAFAILKRTIGMLDVLAGTGGREPMLVKMFQFMGWHARDHTPTPTKAFLYMMGAIRDWRHTTTSSKPVCVMSKDGFTHCGLYCTLDYCWEQLQSEGDVDVFNAARIVKRNRPQLLSTMAEYMYCYSYLTLAVQLNTEDVPSVVLNTPPVIEAEIAEGYELLTGFQNIMSSQVSLADCHNQGLNGTCGVANGGHCELLSNQVDLDLNTGIKDQGRNGMTSSAQAQLNRKLSAPKTQGRIHNRHKTAVHSDSKPVVHNKKENHSEPVLHNKMENQSEPVLHNKIENHSKPVLHNKKENHSKPVLHNKKENHSKPVLHNKKENHSKPVLHNKKENHSKPVLHNKTENHSKPVLHNKKETLTPVSMQMSYSRPC